MSLLCYGEDCDFFTLRPSDLITTLTYVLIDNFCPCLLTNLNFIKFRYKTYNTISTFNFL